MREKIRSAQEELLERFLPEKSRQQWKGAHLAKAKAFVGKVLDKNRKALEQRAEALADLVSGNKNRKVRRPTAELLLKRFKGVCAVWVKLNDGSASVTVLHFDPIHAIILNLLRCPDDIYIRCAKNCFQNCQ